ncbi:MAG TPA: IPTL-CTERM sorting domain-containing protein [Casimicrobiaceae bacterium]|nr:IPTL-CTERM sorting domain-containing protein [Casimicrobiaceae bacterium]
MQNNPKIERIVSRMEPARREAIRKMLVTAAYTAPVVASFSLDSLAQQPPQCANQTGPCVTAVPATSSWSLAVLAGALGAVGAFLLRRRQR